MRDRAWRRAQTRRVQQNRVALTLEVHPYMAFVMEKWWDEVRTKRYIGQFKDSNSGCGCGGCKWWKYKRGRGERQLMKQSDRKRFDSGEDFE